MTAFVDRRTGLDVIERPECLALLGQARVGRLVAASGGSVEIFPVNFALDGDDIVFRSAAGTKVRLAQRSEVAFEVDEIDQGSRTGWSVVARGHVDEVPPYYSALYAETLGVDPWSEGDKPHVLRIRVRTVSGRRIAR